MSQYLVPRVTRGDVTTTSFWPWHACPVRSRQVHERYAIYRAPFDIYSWLEWWLKAAIFRIVFLGIFRIAKCWHVQRSFIALFCRKGSWDLAVGNNLISPFAPFAHGEECWLFNGLVLLRWPLMSYRLRLCAHKYIGSGLSWPGLQACVISKFSRLSELLY